MSVAAPARWLSPAEQRSWRCYLAATRRLLGAVEAQSQRDTGMPFSYYEILSRLSEAGNRTLRMSELAAEALSSRSRLSHAVARLEERGWVRRVDCPTDRRGQLAQLTDEGYAALAAAAPGHVELVRSVLFDALDPDQVAALQDVCEAIIRHLRDTGAAATAGDER
jgi:DNA-binding MarR family transcriptional regulator